MPQSGATRVAQNGRMDTYDTSMSETFRKTLVQRAIDLAEILDRETQGVRAEPDGAGDFKDAAAHEAQDEIEAAQAGHAAHEIAEVRAALRRIADGTYGVCTDCGEPIDLKRLLALPAAAHCADCQYVRDGAARRSA